MDQALDECRRALESLVKATAPYIERAAPHEQLFSGEDVRNFDRLAEARGEAKAALASSSSSHG
jgi:hypothetical protein